MKKLSVIYIFLLLICETGCGNNAPANNANSRPQQNKANASANSANTAPVNQTETPTTGANNAKAANRTANTANTAANVSSKSANQTVSGNANIASSNVSNTSQANSNSTASIPKTEKKDEGLFSFPPPKVISYSVIDNKDLLNKEGGTTFSQVSEKLATGLNKAGYPGDKFSYFWNESDEFAIVTAMERINADGLPLENSKRWDTSTSLPSAHSGSEYFRYLASGKKVYYRVFAFVVTAKRSGQSFTRNTPPDFIMARSWISRGESNLGEGASSLIEDAIFTNKYKCYALLYLFVNHTSLDAVKSLDTLSERDSGLIEEVNRQIADHLRNTNVKFGG